MPSIFSRIIAGEIPARFVWQDETCVAFLSANPLTDGHTLVVPREEVVEWTTCDPGLLAALTTVAQAIGQAQQAHWRSPRVGLMCQGFEVPHLHLHVWPAGSGADFDLGRAELSPDPAHLDEVAVALRAELRERGHAAQVHAG